MVAPVRSRDDSFGRRVAAVIGSLGLAALALVGGDLASAPAQAGQLCGDRGELLMRLEQGDEETPRALGLSTDGGVLEILVSAKGGWTMLVTYPKRPTCVVAVGEAWQMLQLAGQPA
jgi:hypothetical protein